MKPEPLNDRAPVFAKIPIRVDDHCERGDVYLVPSQESYDQAVSERRDPRRLFGVIRDVRL